MIKIILSRAGLQVVFGTVLDVNERYGTVTIGESGLQKMTLYYSTDGVRTLRLSPGRTVIASIKPTEESNALYQGKSLADDICVNAYIIRYSGAFDLPAHEESPEMHVFLGTAYTGTVFTGKGYLAKVSWKKRSEKEERLVYIPSAKVCNFNGKKAVFSTAESKKTSLGEVFVCRKFQILGA